jgi:hypothetical protein
MATPVKSIVWRRGSIERQIGAQAMANDKLRQQVAVEAARLIFRRQEHDPYRATLRAARQLFRGWLKPDEFPTEAEIRLHLQQMSWMHESDARFDNAAESLVVARDLMRRLSTWKPRLVGSAARGGVRHIGQLRIAVFSNDPDEIERALPDRSPEKTSDWRHRRGRRWLRTTLRYPGPLETTIVCYPAELAGRRMIDAATGAAIPTLSLTQLEKGVGRTHGGEAPGSDGHRFEVYRMLLAPLASVQQRKSSHPEGDALYHSLQVFELARQALPYDEEFLLAALLHDVGKAIDPLNHVDAGLSALSGHVTERTEWFIANHHDAHRLRNGTLGVRAKRRLRESPDYEELMTLARCDDRGRVPGGTAPDIDAALDYIRDVARMCGDGA